MISYRFLINFWREFMHISSCDIFQFEGHHTKSICPVFDGFADWRPNRNLPVPPIEQRPRGFLLIHHLQKQPDPLASIPQGQPVQVAARANPARASASLRQLPLQVERGKGGQKSARDEERRTATAKSKSSLL